MLTPCIMICSLKQTGSRSIVFSAQTPSGRKATSVLIIPRRQTSREALTSCSSSQRVGVEVKECDCGRLIFLSPLSKQRGRSKEISPATRVHCLLHGGLEPIMMSINYSTVDWPRLIVTRSLPQEIKNMLQN